MKEIMSIIVVVGGIMANTAFATNRYVVSAGTIDNGMDVPPYNTWTNAATNIQWAVDVATNTETVWVSNGVYVLTNQILITNRIVLRSTNGPDLTVINGNFVAGDPTATTNNRCLLLSNSAAFVAGFTFSNGAFITTVTKTGGGGVQIYGGILSNCTVCNNQLFSPNNGLSDIGGGGIHIRAGTVTVSRVSANTLTNFSGMSASYGGGIYGYGDGSYNNPLISDCVISNNEVFGGAIASVYGGGAYLYFGTIIRSMICNNRNVKHEGGNTGGFGGGLSLYWGYMYSCTVTVNQAGYAGGCNIINSGIISNCMISRNSCSQYSGALHVSAGGVAVPSWVALVYNSTIMCNTSTQDIVRMIPATVGRTNLMKDCLVVSNVLIGGSTRIAVQIFGTNDFLLNSTVSSNGGLGVKISAGTIRNCLIAGNSNANSVVRGGGLLIGSGSNISVSGCTIVGNIDTNASTTGAGLRFENTNSLPGTRVLVSSCVIYSNGIGGTDDVYDACAPTNYNALQYSCVGTNPGFTGAGIIVTNPLFKDFAGGNYRLSSGSPCINAGLNEAWMTNSVDLAGYTRLRFGRVDMGAYEWYPGIKINGVPFEKIRFINGTEPRWINGCP